MGIKRGLYSGLGAGVMWLVIYLTTGIAVWYGFELILEDRDLPEDEAHYTTAILVIVSAKKQIMYN